MSHEKPPPDRSTWVIAAIAIAVIALGVLVVVTLTTGH